MKRKNLNKKDTLKIITEFENMATKLAVDLIESEARKIMSRRSNICEFVMAMGSCFFIDINKQNISNSYNTLNENEFGDIVEFFDMVYELNDTWNIMGFPMRFIANGKVNTKW